ncbi:hypothetical protein [Roseateles terrae]|uniref:Ankyrin repeat domain-containing protein n=1 Tax=Roseateles terrae TaxID=431060 RepID=A0ABR6GYB2_9BURK|nr:hypothetical protein [Roseateles terrae]MBB3197050.1 hypothetical protein [Roseateles terrae]OWQ84215.1 hypothetical protein CDN98_19725 [Roseateles terrae]
MFQPSVPAFLDRARDLYTYRAFDVPPPAVAAPDIPADWQSYDGPDGSQSEPWKRFRQSPQFLQVHRQWLDRIQDCERFALRHCSGQEAADILDAFKTLRARLMNGYGESFATSRITALFGEGKRAMDRVCVRLDQDALPLDFRRRHLREMAYQLHHCLSIGPAYVQAAAALDTPPHGLRGAIYALVCQRSDEVLRQAYLKDYSTRDEALLEGMEAHVVNRMRLEYRLPGADLSDKMSLGTRMFDPRRHPEHHQALRQALAPCRMAEALAEAYWSQLLDRLPPDVPRRSSDQDLNEVVPLIQAAVTALDTALAPVPMTSLLEIDETSDTVRWRRGNALVTRDLLLALEGAGVAVPQPRVVLHRDRSEGVSWQLEGIDDQLFYVMEQSPLLRTPVAVPVGLHHLAAIERSTRPPAESATATATATATASTPPRTTLPDAWLNIVLHDTPTHELDKIPPHWLAKPHHFNAWLARVTPETLVRWIRTTQVRHDAAQHAPRDIVRAMTRQGRTDLLEAAMDSAKAPAIAWLQWGGPDILCLAVAAPCASTFDLWRRRVTEVLPTASPAKVSRWFTPAVDRTLLSCAMDTRHGDRVGAVLAFIDESLTAGVLPPDQLLRHLVCPVQTLMYHGRQDVLPVVGDFLVKAGRMGWLDSNDLLIFLGGKCPGWGCEGVLAGGKNGTLRWYLDLVRQLQAAGALPPSALAHLVAEPSPDGCSVSHVAVRNHHSITLGLFLDQLIAHTHEGRIPLHLLQRQLTCDGDDRSGVHHMTVLPDPACLHVWREAVHKAWRLNLLSCPDVEALVGGTGFSGHPVLRPLVQDDPQLPAQLWIQTVQWLSERGMLTTAQVAALLRADVQREGLPARPLFHQMLLNLDGAKHATRYGFIVSFAHQAGLISDGALEDLLRAENPDRHTPALIDAVEQGAPQVVDGFVETLICMAEVERLPSAALVRLMDGRSPQGRSALATAARRGDRETLQILLDHGLDCLETNVLSPAQWFSLLAPEDHTENPMVAVRTRKDPQLIDLMEQTLRSAETLGALSLDQRLLAASLLGVSLEDPAPAPAE